MSEEKPIIRRRSSPFPKTLGACVEPLTRPVFKAQGIAASRLILDWEKIVGRELSSRCIPLKLSFSAGKTVDGTLTIAAQNGFAPQLQHMQPVLLERLAGYFGYKAISRISISPGFLAPAPKAAAKKPPAPTLPKGSASLVDGVEDPELKAALASFASALSADAT